MLIFSFPTYWELSIKKAMYSLLQMEIHYYLLLETR